MTTEPQPPSAADDAHDDLVVRPKKSAKVLFTSTILVLESFVMVFATLALYGLRTVPDVAPSLPPGLIWGLGGTMVVVLLVLSRLVGRPGGYLAGSLAQLPVVAAGFVVPMMFVVAAIFVVLWVVSLRLGARVDRERAAYDAAHPGEIPPLSPPRAH
ncbi:membrane protein [Flavimobilis marinus]|uniref:DUF4233 domain-containing protein n=1 Tax=Flavimobilis marinus TaxID=285351 RepID=A0A1I2E2D6_9MICO|nr:DUF4233 domain-containing protein [Flavimobilis marinus]GHG43782.1 membrane protein [Flavimobilis marinus]SFE86857.1 Protein of unknown function [Flavimobilis marinus]